MKKLLIAVIMLLAINCVYSQNFVRKGMVFKTENVSKADTIHTDFLWEDKTGVHHPIIVNKNSGACYVWRKSSKTGKMYKSYLPKELSREVCKELNINPKNK